MAGQEQDELRTIKLVSREGDLFIIDKKCALVSETIKSMLVGSFIEGASGEITFREISSPILEKVIQYFYYKVQYTNASKQIPEFVIEPETALELLMAANFLNT